MIGAGLVPQAGYFLSLRQKKVSKEKAPRPSRPQAIRGALRFSNYAAAAQNPPQGWLNVAASGSDCLLAAQAPSSLRVSAMLGALNGNTQILPKASF